VYSPFGNYKHSDAFDTLMIGEIIVMFKNIPLSDTFLSLKKAYCVPSGPWWVGERWV